MDEIPSFIIRKMEDGSISARLTKQMRSPCCSVKVHHVPTVQYSMLESINAYKCCQNVHMVHGILIKKMQTYI